MPILVGNFKFMIRAHLVWLFFSNHLEGLIMKSNKKELNFEEFVEMIKKVSRIYFLN